MSITDNIYNNVLILKNVTKVTFPGWYARRQDSDFGILARNDNNLDIFYEIPLLDSLEIIRSCMQHNSL